MFDLACLFRLGVATIQKKPTKRVVPPHIPQQWVDILAFFDGVELYQSTERYPQFFASKQRPYSQSAVKTLPLVTSITLEEQGGVAVGQKFSGIYTALELNDFFKMLKNSLCSFENFAAFVLASSNHAIVVGFDPKQASWIFLDANQPPAIYVNEDEIGEKVKSAFASGRYTAFATQPYVMQQHKFLFNKCYLNLKSQQDWQDMHAPTNAKVKRIDDEKASWLYVAADNGLIDTVSELLNQGANPNQACADSYTPLYLAAQNGHAAVVEALLKSGAVPDALIEKKYSALYVAADHGYIDVVKILLSYGANPNSEVESPLVIATKNGHIEIVKLLQQANTPKDVQMNDANQAKSVWTQPVTSFGSYRFYRQHDKDQTLPQKREREEEGERPAKRHHTAM